MTKTKEQKIATNEALLRAIEDAIRYRHLELISRGEGTLDVERMYREAHMQDYEIKNLFNLHCDIVKATYRSNEMREKKSLTYSIWCGTDIGTQFLLEGLQGKKDN